MQQYTENNFPVQMNNLDYRVRLKAIELLNAMIAGGEPVGKSIPIAIDEALEWAESNPNGVQSSTRRGN
jgi:uncharacterized protein YdaT